MKAQFVCEKISFNRGVDPRDSLFGLRSGQLVVFNKERIPDSRGYLRKGIFYIQRVFKNSSGEIEGYQISRLGDVVYYRNIEGYPRFERLAGQHHTSVRKDEVIAIQGMDKEVSEKWLKSVEGQKKKEYIEKWEKIVPFVSEF